MKEECSMANEINRDERQFLLNSLEICAIWCDKVKAKKDELNSFESGQAPQTPFPEFSENTKYNEYFFLITVIFVLTYIYDVFSKVNIYPDGFFMGILLFVIVLAITIYLYTNSAVPEDPGLRASRYAQWEKDRAEHVKKENELQEKYYKTKMTLKSELDDLLKNKQNVLTFVPEGYLDARTIRRLASYVRDRRADSIKEALNLYHQEKAEQERQEQINQRLNQMQQTVEETRRAAYEAEKAAYWAEPAARSARNKLDS